MPAAASSTVRDRLAAAAAALAEAGVPAPRADAEWLLAHVLGIGRTALRMLLDRPLDSAVLERYRVAVARRRRRAPLQQIAGWEGFHGLRLTVTPDVLVPRPETELLVEWALGFLPPPGAGARLLVVDVGTGSGCIACAIAHARPDARVLAIDVSPAAATVARDNVRALGLASTVTVVVGDLLALVGGERAALIVSNPPYLASAMLDELPPEVAAYEPRSAVAGGADGLAFLRPIVAGAPAQLAPGGALVLETAGGAQAGRVAALLREAGFVDVTTRRDLAGVERFVAGVTPRGLPDVPSGRVRRADSLGLASGATPRGFALRPDGRASNGQR